MYSPRSTRLGELGGNVPVFLFLLLGGIAGAEPLDWKTCLEEAAGRNPELAASRAAVEGAEHTLRATRTSFLPNLSANAGYTQLRGSSAFAGGFGDGAGTATAPATDGAFGGREGYSVGLSARQGLFTGFRRIGEVEQSAARLAEARETLRATEAQVTFDVASAFAELLFAQQQVTLAEEIERRRRENVRLVELRYEAGREHKGSALRIAAAAHDALFELSRARRAVTVAQRSLARVLGREDSSVLGVAGDFPIDPPERPVDFRALADEVPATRQAQAQEEAARAGVTVAKSQLYPAIDAVLSLTRRDEEFPPESDVWTAGVALSYPFFPGGRNFFEILRSEADDRRSRWNSSGVEEQVILELERSFVEYEDSVENVEVRRRFVEAADLRSEIARAQYTNGLLSFEDWDLIENDLIEARRAMLASLREAAIARARWDLARGASSL